MDVLFLSPAYPPEMQQFTRGLAEVGARVYGVGDTPVGSLPDAVKARLTDYLQVPAILDEDDVIRRVCAWLGSRRPDRIEGLWEVVTTLAARLREQLGVPGMSVDTVHGFRDKVVMKQRVAAAGVRVPRAIRAHSVADIRGFAEAVGFPLILKPVDGAGSADTWRVGSARELAGAVERVRHLDQISVEEFVTGQEYTFETLCHEGRILFTSVSLYLPNTLEARQAEWISPIILTLRDPDDPEVAAGLPMATDVIAALGMGSGFTHMEWFVRPDGTEVFGEIACRPPGANMVDLMNYANDVDLYREWARIVTGKRFEAVIRRPWNAALIFKRAQGTGRIRAIEGLDGFLARHGAHVARVDLLPIGAHRRDWKQTFLSDGNLVVRHPDRETCVALAREAASTIHLYAS